MKICMRGLLLTSDVFNLFFKLLFMLLFSSYHNFLVNLFFACKALKYFILKPLRSRENCFTIVLAENSLYTCFHGDFYFYFRKRIH